MPAEFRTRSIKRRGNIISKITTLVIIGNSLRKKERQELQNTRQNTKESQSTGKNMSKELLYMGLKLCPLMLKLDGY